MIRPDDDNLHRLWQEGNAALEPLPLDEIRSRAMAFGRTIGQRNRREYIATAFVMLIFGVYAAILPGIWLKAGSLLVIAGSVVMARELSRRTSKFDANAEAVDVRAYYRARLVTEERMLMDVGRWYLGPLIPGLAVFIAGLAIASGFDSALGFAAFAAPPALVFFAIWLLNRQAAAMLRKQIARFDSTVPIVEGERE